MKGSFGALGRLLSCAGRWPITLVVRSLKESTNARCLPILVLRRLEGYTAGCIPLQPLRQKSLDKISLRSDRLYAWCVCSSIWPLAIDQRARLGNRHMPDRQHLVVGALVAPAEV